MRLLAGLSFAVAALLAATAGIAAPLDTLVDCAARAKPATVGFAALEQQCPGLDMAISDLGYSRFLGDAWQRGATPGALAHLAGLVQIYLRSDRHEEGPDVAPVRGIVDALARERSAAAPTPWDALKAWLRSLLANKGDKSLAWLDRWLDQLAGAAGAMTMLMYALLLGVLALAATFILGELRTAGLLSRGRRAVRAAAPAETACVDGPQSEALLDAVPSTERPAILLHLLVDALSRKGRLLEERHLTHRELIAHAVLDDAAQRTRFARVARLAEGLLYGPKPGPTEGLDSVVREGRQLLAQIDRSSIAA